MGCKSSKPEETAAVEAVAEDQEKEGTLSHVGALEESPTAETAPDPAPDPATGATTENQPSETAASEGDQPKEAPASKAPKVGTGSAGFVGSSKPVSRHAWIVLNVDGRKVGKLVMALKGKGVAQAVDNFEEIYKGKEVEPLNLSIDEADPPLYIVTKQQAKGVEEQDGVHGIVQEGEEILDQIREVGEDSIVTVKQAHIYPVKVAK